MSNLGTRPLTVFAVEDESMIAILLESMVDDLGHSLVASAADVADAVAIAQTVVCDVAILDIDLRGKNVLPVAHILNERGIPFIFASGFGVSGSPTEFADRPAVEKPFLLETLDDALTRAISTSMRFSVGRSDGLEESFP